MLKELFLLCGCLALSCHGYKIGVGIADMTGPTVEVAFMGYANPDQKGRGIHLRQFARTFIIDDGTTKLAFVNTDAGMMGSGVRKIVLDRLKGEFGDEYTEQNLMLSGTHTHSTPGGFLMDIAFDLNSFGFVKETFNGYVEGIVRSIRRAHESMTDGKIFVTRGEILDANINRSPLSYLNNPKEERDRYQYNTDKTFLQLKMVTPDGSPIGALTWYAVHGTSMNNTNTLVSSDNVGYAATMFEQRINKGSLVGKGKFVAAFASTNLGDVSPNTAGPKCQMTGGPCDPLTSTCPNSNERCVASGPGKNMEESASIIAHRILEQAWKAWNTEGEELSGPVNVVHQFVDMPKQQVNFTDPNTGNVTLIRGCSPAMGYSFAAGTTDGPGMFSFKQGTKSTNPLWNLFTDILAKPTKEMIECQAPKPILLATGEMNWPYEWQPSIVSTQLGRIGPLTIVCVPGEFTTMSGRRMRDTLSKVLGIPSSYVVIAGLCNTYADYVATPEEYQIQRYEGASTIFGPNTLNLYLHQYSELAKHLQQGTRPGVGPSPPVTFKSLISLLPGVLFDYSGWGKEFGQVTLQPVSTAKINQTVTAKFVAGNPRNNLMQENTFLSVEKLQDNQTWLPVASDANWETKFIWIRTSTILGTSEAKIEWKIPHDTSEGTYRIRHFGYYKHITGDIKPYDGTSSSFQVVKS